MNTCTMPSNSCCVWNAQAPRRRRLLRNLIPLQVLQHGMLLQDKLRTGACYVGTARHDFDGMCPVHYEKN
jgi:hypothetical protein